MKVIRLVVTKGNMETIKGFDDLLAKAITKGMSPKELATNLLNGAVVAIHSESIQTKEDWKEWLRNQLEGLMFFEESINAKKN